MADIQWRIAVPENVDKQSGIYFLRTNVSTFAEKTTWDYYNLTREIECTNHQLKTDLNLRPMHHQKDDKSDAHFFSACSPTGLSTQYATGSSRQERLVSGQR